MPFGPFKDFDDCVKSFMDKGDPEEVAGRKCSAIKDRLEGLKSKGKNKKADLTSFSYEAGIEVFDAEKHLAKVWLIDPSINENDWGVTKESISKYANTVIGKPLIGPPKEGHEGTDDYGKFIETQVNGTAFGIVNVTDDNAWKKLQAGEWKYVSPEVVPTCDISRKGGADILNCFRFNHVALVEEPAFGPKARVKDTFIADKPRSFWASLKAYSSKVNKGVVCPTCNVEIMSECDEKEKTLKAEIEKKDAVILKFKAEDEKRNAEKQKTTNPPETPNLSKELDSLRKWRAEKETEERNSLAEDVIKLQGSLRKLEAGEEDGIRKMSIDTLKTLRATLTPIKTVWDTRPSVTPTPRYGYTAETKDTKPVDFNTIADITHVGVNR